MEMTGGSGGEEGTLKGASVPLITVTRNGETDMEHLGFACLVDADGKCIWSLGDPHAKAFFRSSAKPLQALTLVESGGADAAGLDEADLAIICGSNLGGPEQVAQVKSLLAKSGLAEKDLGCGDGLKDMCSGKHAGMLTACKHLGLPLDTYLDPDHPWQRRLLSTLCGYCAVNAEDVRQAVDGCSAPTVLLPLYNMALGFARLGRASAHAGPVARLLRAMTEHPGGHTGEPDLRPFRLLSAEESATLVSNPSPAYNPSPASKPTSEYHPSLPGPTANLSGPTAALVTKGGANGLHCAVIPALGLGFALKVIDGSALPRWPVFIRALELAGLISSATAGEMRRAISPKIETRRGAPAGSIRTDF